MSPFDDTRPSPLRPAELAGDDALSSLELGMALEVGRAVEAVASAPDLAPRPGFADRVMARVRTEPPPSRRGYLLPLRRLGPSGLLASIGQAWAFAGTGGRPIGARATALAYVLAVVLIGASLTGAAAYGVAGAFGLLEPDRSPSPTAPLDTIAPVEPTLTPAPLSEPPATRLAPTDAPPTPEVSAEPEESIEPEESEDDDRPGSAEPDETAEESDEHEDDDEHETPEPSKTPKPSSTPQSGTGGSS